MAPASWGRSLADVGAIVPRRPGDGASPDRAHRPPRRLAYDHAEERVGEIMPDVIPAHLCDPSTPSKVRLRPVGGGCEWIADAADVELIPPLGGES